MIAAVAGLVLALGQSTLDQGVEDALASASVDESTARAELAEIARREPRALVRRLDLERELGPDWLPVSKEAELLADALSELATGTLERVLEPTPDLDPAARCARLAVVGRGDGTEHLAIAIDLATSDSVAVSTAGALREVATRLHERSDAVGRTLPREARQAPLPLAASLIHALSDVDRPSTANRLADLLGDLPELDAFVLGQLGRHVSPLDDLEIRLRVRERLDDDSADVRREAVSLVARLHDYDSVERLIVLLSDDHPGVRGNARRALERLGELQLGADPLRWRTWHELNQTWWNLRWPDLRRALATGNRNDTVAAMRDCAGRRYRYHEIARSVADVLTRTDDPFLLEYACLSLASLRSPYVARDLVPLLTDTRDSVRTRAHECLLRITDLELPPDAEAWAQALPETRDDD